MVINLAGLIEVEGRIGVVSLIKINKIGNARLRSEKRVARRRTDIASKRVVDNKIFEKWVGEIGLKKRGLVGIEKNTRERGKRNLI